MDDGDPVMEMYEAQTLLIEKEAEYNELRIKSEELEREQQQRNREETSSCSRDVWEAMSQLVVSNALQKQRVEQIERKLEESMSRTETRKLEETETIKIMNARVTALEETDRFDRIEIRLEEIAARLERNEQKGMMEVRTTKKGLLKSERTYLREIFNEVPCFEKGSFYNEKLRLLGGEQMTLLASSSKLGDVVIKKVASFTTEALKEISILVKVHHPQIVNVYGISLFEDVPSGVVMDYMRTGSLDKVIHDLSTKYEPSQVYSWVHQATTGLMYLHEMDIIHRDIKPSNLLLGDSMDDLKLCDFGSARIGTLSYAAPEVLRENKYTRSSDVYSLAITIWEMTYRMKPYDDLGKMSDFQFVNMLLEGKRPPIEPYIVDSDLSELLISSWNHEAFKRVSMKEISQFAEEKLFSENKKYRTKELLRERPS